MSVLAGNLLERVGEIIPRYSMLSAGDGVGVAVSGGADSVVLLHILHRLSARFPLRLQILHVNHRLRGVESDEDEEFVRTLGYTLGIEVDVERSETVPKGNLEEAARDARRLFFRRCMEEHGLKRVALGHTRSDQAETILFRFLRGSGLAGLAGMRMVTADGLIRPLLTTSREEVRDWAKAEGIAWREDSSNADTGFARNRLRNEAIPALARDFNSNLEAVLAGIGDVAQGEEEYWVQQIEPLYRKIAKRTHLGSFFQLAALNAVQLAVRRRLIRRALIDVRGDLLSINKEHVDAILAICTSAHGHDRVIVPGVDAFRSFDTLLLARPGERNSERRHYRVPLSFGGEYRLPFDAGIINVTRMNPEPQFCANFKKDQEFPAEVGYLEAAALTSAVESNSFYVRNWEPGDELWRSGHRGPEKIKALFQEHRVLLWERRHWPVLVAGDEIVWVRRFGVSAKFGASAESRDAIRLVYQVMKDESSPGCV